MNRSRIALCVLGIVLFAAAAAAQVPSVVPFQGVIRDAGGNIVGAGTQVQFRIWDAATGGTSLWGPETQAVTPQNGIVSVFLGAGAPPVAIDPAAVFAGGDRYLEITVGGTTLTPRVRLGSTPYAMTAGRSGTTLTGNAPGSPATMVLSTTAATARTMAFTAPGRGQILATASGFLEMSLALTTSTYAFVNLSTSSTPAADYGDGIVVLRTPNTLPAGSYFTIPWSVTRVFPVTGDGTIYVHGKINSGSNSGTVYVTSMTALFVPN